MFIETHLSSTENGIPLTFIKSINVQAYPCGRRRSEKIVENDANNDGSVTESEKYRIPFDPEARLNTEANNIKHSGLNGFTQTYLNRWDDDLLSLVLGGYLFTIRLDNEYQTFSEFGNKLAEKLGGDAKNVYANIRIEETPIFKGFEEYYTGVLRDQTANAAATTCLDLLKTVEVGESVDTADINNYYFSGLSFSANPLVNSASSLTENNAASSVEPIYDALDANKLHQRIISLHLLEKIGSQWQLYQPALLPKIEHGGTEGSIKFETAFADNIKLLHTNENGETVLRSVPSLSVVETSEGSGIYQLQFSYGKN